jgi:extracellular factor (EF) 3-hydroxypalmitic acid methyl ester biosynthesis protein
VKTPYSGSLFNRNFVVLKQSNMQIATATNFPDILKQLDYIKQKGSFDAQYYPAIDDMITTISSLKKQGEIGDNEIAAIRKFFGQDFLENTLHGMALLKKYGYAGDFLMIDKIYTGNAPEHPFHQSWDKYFQEHAAPKAVRNRKTYFKSLIHKKLQTGDPVNLLNVASGPARDLLELYNEIENKNIITTTCVEMDTHAITYAQTLIKEYAAQIKFINKNIFKFDTEEKFTVIWSAGLFDYFDDKAFVYILKKFSNWVTPGGEIVVGNFNHKHNPTREYMELFGDWYLHHRTAGQLIDLALEAGFNTNQLSVDNEQEKVNLFLHIKC